MSQQQEVVLRNAIVWAYSPITKIRGGMRVKDGRIVELFKEVRDSPGEGSSIDLEGMHIIPGLIDRAPACHGR